MLKFLFFILLLGFVEFVSFNFIKNTTKSNWLLGIYLLVSISILILLATIFINRQAFSIPISNLVVAAFLMVYASKITFATVIGGAQLYHYGKNQILNNSPTQSEIAARRKFIGQFALGIAAIPFSTLLYGIFRGKYNFTVHKHTLYFDDLPEAFENYQLTHISDIHSGSFDNKEKIAYAVNLINQQQSDTILFTGDMVNLTADEMLPWKDTFSKLQAKDGIFSVLGNHDYGDYATWLTDEGKKESLQQLKDIQKEMGFNLLLNQTHFIEKNNERLAIIGVENWGKGFVQKGDLDKASENVHPNDFKITLSHDPTHWEEKIIPHKNTYHLTLSGHTHGMQMGIEIPNLIKWSPIKWRYKHWAGIYKENNQYINVNRGFGFLAYPGRVGIAPEITVLTLKKTQNS